MDDAEIVMVSYGSVARTVLQAVMLARGAGIKVGCIQLYTIWPFPTKKLSELLTGKSKVIVAELNMGQLIREVERVAPAGTAVSSLLRYDGEIFTPTQLIEAIEQAART